MRDSDEEEWRNVHVPGRKRKKKKENRSGEVRDDVLTVPTHSRAG